MKIRTYPLAILLAMFLPVSLLAQRAPMKLGKIDKADLTLTECSFDPEAEAMVLGEYGELHLVYITDKGWQYKFDYHIRIKVFSAEGLAQATQVVELYEGSRSNREELSQLKGYTYNLVDGKVEKEKMRNDDEFEEELSEHITAVKFTLPAVQVGSVFEFSYSIRSDYISNLRSWYFQRDIPVRFSEARYLLPEFFYYRTVNAGGHPLTVNETDRQNEVFSIRYEAGRQVSGAPVYRTSDLRSQSKLRRWRAEQVPAIRQEPYMTRVRDYATRVEFQLATIRYPNQSPKSFMDDYPTMSNTLLEDAQFGEVFLKGGYQPEGIEAALAQAEGPLDQALATYETLRRGLRWNKRYAIYARQNTRQTWRNEGGNVADLNLALVDAYREAGLEAHPVLLSTRDHGKVHPVYPNLEAFNYVIASVKVGDNWFLTDATRASLPFGLLPLEAINGQGWWVRPNQWIDLRAGTRYR